MSCQEIVFLIMLTRDYPHYSGSLFERSKAEKHQSEMATICLMSKCEREGWIQATENGINVF